MNYNYFVSFSISKRDGSTQIGNWTVDINSPINDGERIRNVEQYILKQDPNWTNIVLISFQLLTTYKKGEEDQNIVQAIL